MNPFKSVVEGGSGAVTGSGEVVAASASTGAGNVVGSSAGMRRKRIVFENGDRYCSTCGQAIYGMAREFISRCPYHNCKAVQPYMERLWQFQKNGWSRCKGVNCSTFIEIDMLYCSTCGTVNAPAFERRDRQARAKMQQEEGRLLAKIKELERRQAVMDAENREMRDTIKSQETELFLAKELPPSVESMLLADEDRETTDGNSEA